MADEVIRDAKLFEAGNYPDRNLFVSESDLDKIIAGTTTIGGDQCPKCRGTGKVLCERQFPLAQLELARWMLAEVEREMATAGPAAMAALAPKLDL